VWLAYKLVQRYGIAICGMSGMRIVTTPATNGGSARLRGLLDALEHGQLFWFADWPVAAVPKSGAMVYTVWNRAGHFIYVGMAGRGETAASTSRRGCSGTDSLDSYSTPVAKFGGVVCPTAAPAIASPLVSRASRRSRRPAKCRFGQHHATRRMGPREMGGGCRDSSRSGEAPCGGTGRFSSSIK
jgi:hypothetical protein